MRDELAVALEERKVDLTHGCVTRAAVLAAADEEILDHRAGSQEVQPGEEQLGVCRNALEDGVRQLQPPFQVVSRERRLVCLQQRDEIADQQRGVHGVRVARDRENVRMVDRLARLPGPVT